MIFWRRKNPKLKAHVSSNLKKVVQYFLCVFRKEKSTKVLEGASSKTFMKICVLLLVQKFVEIQGDRIVNRYPLCMKKRDQILGKREREITRSSIPNLQNGVDVCPENCNKFLMTFELSLGVTLSLSCRSCFVKPTRMIRLRKMCCIYHFLRIETL